MVEIPKFFVPNVPPEDEETAFGRLAEWCRQPVPERERRIYSITYTHDGEEWTATVGQRLHGIRRRRPSRKRSMSPFAPEPPPEHLSDSATVLAIFAGVPYFVVTNKRLEEGVRSAWENPFMAGQPSSVTLFSA